MKQPYVLIPVGTVLRIVLFTAAVVALVVLLLASGGDPAAAHAVGSAVLPV